MDTGTQVPAMGTFVVTTGTGQVVVIKPFRAVGPLATQAVGLAAVTAAAGVGQVVVTNPLVPGLHETTLVVTTDAGVQEMLV